MQSWHELGIYSIRLPEEVERGLERESEVSGRNRSELVREAIGEYLTRKERERFRAEMIAAAKALYSDPVEAKEARKLQADLDAVDTSIDRIIDEELASGIDPEEKWWD